MKAKKADSSDAVTTEAAPSLPGSDNGIVNRAMALFRARGPEAALLALGVVIILVVYRRVWGLYFVGDTWGDLYAVADHGPLSYFMTDTYAGRLGRHYRPIWRVSGWIQHKLSGEVIFDPRIYFAFQMTWFLLTAVGAFVVARLLHCRALPALLGMLFFALHPAIVEPICWVAAESYLLAGVFSIWGLVALLASWRWEALSRRRRHRLILQGISLLLMTLAILSNELALGLVPGLIVLTATLRWDIRRGLVASGKDFLRVHGPFLFVLGVVGLAYLGVRVALFGAISNWAPEPSPQPVTRVNEISDFFKTYAAFIAWNQWPSWLDNKVALIDPYLYIMMGLVGTGVLGWFAAKGEGWAGFLLLGILCYVPFFSNQRLWVYDQDPIFGTVIGGRLLYLSLLFGAPAVALILNRTCDVAGWARRPILFLVALYLCQSTVSARLNIRIYEAASQQSRLLVKALPELAPEAKEGATVALVGLPPFTRFVPVEGMYVNHSILFLVGPGALARFAFEPHKVDVKNVRTAQEAPPGSIKIAFDERGEVRRIP